MTDTLTVLIKSYMYLKKYNKLTQDKVRFCKGNVCLEANGENARLLTGVFTFVLICIGISTLAKA